MAKVTKIEEGSVIEAGTVMYTVHLQGREDPILIEFRSNEGMEYLMPPFGIVAVHGVCALSKAQEAVIEAACAMFYSPKGPIGDLKRAARGLIKLRGLQTGQRTGRHLTAQELAIVRLAFPSLHGILGEEHLKKALDTLESQGRNWAEELEL